MCGTVGAIPATRRRPRRCESSAAKRRRPRRRNPLNDMKPRGTLLWKLAALALAGLAASAYAPTNEAQMNPPAGMAFVPAGIFTAPFQRGKIAQRMEVKGFFFDASPVRSGEFLEFVRLNPAWRRSQVERRLAD